MDFTLKISEEGLQVIMAALECYSRLGINQFSYCLEHNPAFDKLGWDDKRRIEDYLKHEIDARNFGIHHPEVERFNQAFQIKKEIQKNIAIARQPVRNHLTNEYDGAMGDLPCVPVFLDENGEAVRDEIRICVPKKHRVKLRKMIYDKDFKTLWDFVDKNIDFKGVRGNSTRITDDAHWLIVSQPYRLTQP